MKYCSRCGNEVVDEAVICHKCGSQVASYGGKNVQSDENGFAIAGFICSFFSPFFGWIFGGIGLNRAKTLNGKGKSLSIAAIIIATILFILYVIVTILLALAQPQSHSSVLMTYRIFPSRSSLLHLLPNFSIKSSILLELS
jgi:uncharacterized membrane protein YvbJ